MAWLLLITLLGTGAAVIIGKWGSKTVPGGIEELEERLL